MKAIISLLVSFSIFFLAESRATLDRQPISKNKPSSFESLANIFYHPTEEFKTALEGFVTEVGLQEWSEILLKAPYGNSNEQYEAVVNDLESRKIFNITLPPGFKNLTIDCKLCMGIVYGLKYALTNSNYTFVVEKGKELCKIVMGSMGFRAEPLCEGTIDLYGPHAEIILRKNILFLRDFCPFQNACLPPRKESLMFQISDIDDSLSDEAGTTTEEEETFDDSDIFTIAQISDIHMEETYEEKTETECGLAVCCVPKWGKGFAGYWGEYQCNIPVRTFESFIQKVKSFKPDLVLFTGDLAPHTFWEETFDSQMQATTTSTKLLQKHFDKVLPVIGNHETYPTNLFSLAELKESKDFINHFITSWKTLASLGSENEQNLRNGGFYSQLIVQGLRIVTFNSMYMYTYNFYNVFNHKSFFLSSEAKRTYNFIRDALSKALRNKEKVILAFHNPMGISDFVVSQSIELEKILVEFKNTLVLVVNGHTHYNEFRVVYDEKKPAVVTLAAPSVSSNNYRNPAMRLYRLHKKSFTLLDYQQYYLDLSKLENVQSTNISEHIKELYSAKKEYQLPDLSPQSWHSLINRLENDQELLYKHMSHFNTDAREVGKITPSMKKEHICRLKNIHYDFYRTCLNFTLPDFTLPPNLPTALPTAWPPNVPKPTRRPRNL